MSGFALEMTDQDLLDLIFKADNEGRWATALELCLVFEKRTSEHLIVRIVHAGALTKLNRFTEAKELLLKTHGDQNASATIKYHCQCGLGHALTEMGRFDDARAAYEIAHRLQPDNDHPLIYLGALELGCGNFVKARDWLNRALNCRGQSHDEAHFNLGSSYLAEQNYSEAIEHYRKAIEADPDYKLAKDFLEDAKNALSIRNKSDV